MSKFYKPQRIRNLYDPKSKEAFKISRSKIELFVACPRCFYIDRRLGTGRPPGFPFNLNSAVDFLLKKEFDVHRAENKNHPLIEKYGVDARPVSHKDLDEWRENFKGVQYLHKPTGLILTGAIDDLWINSKGEYVVVDYKATSKNKEITSLDEDWQIGYKRQMEIYQWLLRQKGYTVSDVGYFVYCNGKTDAKAFDGRLEFDIALISYVGDDSWIEETVYDLQKCLNEDKIPMADSNCDYCNYIKAVNKHLKQS